MRLERQSSRHHQPFELNEARMANGRWFVVPCVLREEQGQALSVTVSRGSRQLTSVRPGQQAAALHLIPPRDRSTLPAPREPRLPFQHSCSEPPLARTAPCLFPPLVHSRPLSPTVFPPAPRGGAPPIRARPPFAPRRRGNGWLGGRAPELFGAHLRSGAAASDDLWGASCAKDAPAGGRPPPRPRVQLMEIATPT